MGIVDGRWHQMSKILSLIVVDRTTVIYQAHMNGGFVTIVLIGIPYFYKDPYRMCFCSKVFWIDIATNFDVFFLQVEDELDESKQKCGSSGLHANQEGIQDNFGGCLFDMCHT